MLMNVLYVFVQVLAHCTYLLENLVDLVNLIMLWTAVCSQNKD